MTLFNIQDSKALSLVENLVSEGWHVTAVSFVRGYRSVSCAPSVLYGHDRKGFPTAEIYVANLRTSVKSNRYYAVIRLRFDDIDLPF